VTFKKELEHLINKYSKENGSNTPDFILAKFMNGCLKTFDAAVKRRENWYGHTPECGRTMDLKPK